MRRILLLIAGIVLMTMTLVPASAQTTWEQPDQSATYVGNVSQGMGTFTYAQTFTAGISGLLSRVSLNVYRGFGEASLTVDIRETTIDGLPTGNESLGSGTVLASATVSHNVPNINNPTDFVFATPPTIQSGTLYAIVVKASGNGWNWGHANSYASGQGNDCATTCWSAMDNDFAFQTYVGTPDPTAPTGTVSINNGATHTNSPNVNLSLTCQDDISGCASMQFSTDGTTFTDPVPFAATASFTLPAIDGTRTVYVRFTDAAGNPSTVVSDSITLDTVAPSTSAIDGPDFVTNATDAELWFESNEPDVTYLCQLRDEVPLPDSYVACPNPMTYSPLPDSTYIFSVKAVDLAGNVDQTPATWTWTVETVTPTVTIEKALGQADPTNASSVTFDVRFSEPVTGFDATDLDITRDPTLSAPTVTIAPATGPASDYTVTLSGLTGNGDISVAILANAAEDAAGNDSAASTSSTDNTITIDQAAPVTTASVAGTQGQDGWYQSATVTLTPNEPATTTYIIDGGGPLVYTASFAVTPDGIHTVTFASLDGAGNQEITQTLTVKVDGAAPVIQPLEDQTLDPTSSAGAPVSFTPVVTDNLSSAGIITASCTYQNSNPFVSGQFAPAGTTTITCTVTDLAGNTATESFTVTVNGAEALWEQLRATIRALDLTSSTERTLLMQTTIAEQFANSGPSGMACMQLSALDLSIRAQESRRRISPQDAAEIYTQTLQLRNVIGCGGTNT